MTSIRNFFNQSPQLPGFLGNFANAMNMFKQFSSNPMGALLGMNVNIPQNLANNPQAMVQHLIGSGQMSQEQFNQLSKTANLFQQMMQGPGR